MSQSNGKAAPQPPCTAVARYWRAVARRILCSIPPLVTLACGGGDEWPCLPDVRADMAIEALARPTRPALGAKRPSEIRAQLLVGKVRVRIRTAAWDPARDYGHRPFDVQVNDEVVLVAEDPPFGAPQLVALPGAPTVVIGVVPCTTEDATTCTPSRFVLAFDSTDGMRREVAWMPDGADDPPEVVAQCARATYLSAGNIAFGARLTDSTVQLARWRIAMRQADPLVASRVAETPGWPETATGTFEVVSRLVTTRFEIGPARIRHLVIPGPVLEELAVTAGQPPPTTLSCVTDGLPERPAHEIEVDLRCDDGNVLEGGRLTFDAAQGTWTYTDKSAAPIVLHRLSTAVPRSAGNTATFPPALTGGGAGERRPTFDAIEPWDGTFNAYHASGAYSIIVRRREMQFALINPMRPGPLQYELQCRGRLPVDAPSGVFAGRVVMSCSVGPAQLSPNVAYDLGSNTWTIVTNQGLQIINTRSAPPAP